MKTKPVLIVLAIAASGMISTLVSGLFGRDLSTLGVSRVGYGFPLVWHGYSWVVYPDMPTVHWYSLESFLLDTAFWSLVIVLFVLISRWLVKTIFFQKSRNNSFVVY